MKLLNEQYIRLHLYKRTIRLSHIVCLLLMWLVLPIPGPGTSFAARDDVPLEYKLKAAFTFNFIKFIDWPVVSSEDEGSVFTLYVLGSGPINDALSGLDGKAVTGRTISFRKVDDVDEVKKYGILFVNEDEDNNLPEIFAKTRKAGVLTISEMEGFCERGGIINFVIRDDSINFEINLEEAKRSGMSISYKLLNQAIKIYK